MLDEFLRNLSVGFTVAVSTLGTWLVSALGMIPDDITKLASLFSMVLIVVMVKSHLTNQKKAKLDMKKSKLEIEVLERQKKINRDK